MCFGDRILLYELYARYTHSLLNLTLARNYTNVALARKETFNFAVRLFFRFQSLQKLRTDGAVDWEFFKVGQGLAQEYFIAVANHVKVLPNGAKTYEIESVIYKWNKDLFVTFQCVKTFGAKKWTAIHGKCKYKSLFTCNVTKNYKAQLINKYMLSCKNIVSFCRKKFFYSGNKFYNKHFSKTFSSKMFIRSWS